MHRHIQQIHLFSSKIFIQFSWFSPLQAPLPFPPPSKFHPFLERNTFCVLPGSERLRALLLFVFNLSSVFLSFFGRLCWCAEVLGSTKKKPVNFALVDNARVMYSTFPPPKKRNKTKQNKKHTRGREGEEKRRELEEEEKEKHLAQEILIPEKRHDA